MSWYFHLSEVTISYPHLPRYKSSLEALIIRHEKMWTRLPEILSKALSVSFDTNIGHDYIDNADERYDFYKKKEDKIPFDINMLNTITKGGISRKTLNIILAGTGVGKSLAMCHFASAALSDGKNVLYIRNGWRKDCRTYWC